jgi:hypothetical protein
MKGILERTIPNPAAGRRRGEGIRGERRTMAFQPYPGTPDVNDRSLGLDP